MNVLMMILPAVSDTSPLSFIFENTAYQMKDGLIKKIVPQEREEMIASPWRCSNISPDNCCKGNLLLCKPSPHPLPPSLPPSPLLANQRYY